MINGDGLFQWKSERVGTSNTPISQSRRGRRWQCNIGNQRSNELDARGKRKKDPLKLKLQWMPKILLVGLSRFQH